MVNNVKSYLYRFAKSSSSIVCALLLLTLHFFPPVLSFLFLTIMGNDISSFDSVNIFEEFLGQFKLITLILLIFTTVFFSNDEKNGFIKNMIPVQNKRYNIFISRAVFILIYLTAAVIFSLIFFSISYKLFFHGTAQFEITSGLIAEYGICMLISYAVLLTFAMIGVAAGGTALPLTVGILYILNFFSLAIVFVNVLVRKITGFNAFNANCVLLPNLYDNVNYTLFQRLLVPALYIVISAVTAAFIFEKRDIR